MLRHMESEAVQSSPHAPSSSVFENGTVEKLLAPILFKAQSGQLVHLVHGLNSGPISWLMGAPRTQIEYVCMAGESRQSSIH